ncbi:MAG: tRNA (adenosine(37)-N6)-threonylcarbamoyltransferase complex transferase subunit TsaD [Spirochaetes bacterium GWD1_61_31]|nr:MAG: tRNA (adenosine(37)-N6)-threonylcarbamoyltransferase complex transferase subunit TsaD [Spirochaetes bacterium GWB1_60_80]OHD35000.1 MAG: tRNA (adenosine(37)-N6)-threonylcarbamoyltransferase complex transferase subunit TsaD [Spirochaetes bacterium GWC1_61_12]OHD38533.1 MAG: tRNA (adenosine(37)-N6)-threonylcarbamoyltransferase complex transferase subunit TsaD [Spirochaetes bacterium GWD1_61_31]OHD43050.1 MAG: tRNA (adenosine(37)-N6)-threonylcarbamoyltransferase complex transferase subunit 
MLILGIESSCDECAAAVVRDGRQILSNIIASQVELHARWSGVVPELASRLHAEWIQDVVSQALAAANCTMADIDGIAVTDRPGLVGALLVGVSFAKALAWSCAKPLVGVNHILAHLYAPLLAEPVEYPFIGLIVSGGHSLICRADGFDDIAILGTTIDDAVGEAFDKVAKHYGFGYPGGVAIDRLARSGDARACRFPVPFLYKGKHKTYDVSYSGLKTAAIRQLDQFWNPAYPRTDANLAAAFEKAAIDMLCGKLLLAAEDTGIKTIVAGGGVAANSYLRSVLANHPSLRCFFPPLALCGDNGAMIAGLGFRLLQRGDRAGLDLNASPRVAGFRRT